MQNIVENKLDVVTLYGLAYTTMVAKPWQKDLLDSLVHFERKRISRS